MSLTLHYHPLASFCWKVLIGLYENATPFEGVIVDLGDDASRSAFYRLTPWRKMPVLEDRARGVALPETSIILEYLDQAYPGAVRFIPDDAERALEVRLWDRTFDLYVHHPMQRIVADRLRPEADRDPYGVAEARAQLAQGYELVEAQLEDREWACGEFGLADCAAAPALFYADKVAPFGEAHSNVRAYLERLKARPAFARVLAEAEPYFELFPG